MGFLCFVLDGYDLGGVEKVVVVVDIYCMFIDGMS